MPQLARTPGAGPDFGPPPDEAALLAAAQEYTLPSGRVVWWLQPDELEMMAFHGTLPDPILGKLFVMLRDEGSLEDKPRLDDYRDDLNEIQAQYHVIKHGMVKPRFDPSLAIGDGNGTIGRRELTRGDRLFVYHWLFRLGTTPEARELARIDQLTRLANATRDSDGVPHDASTADGD
jgi:hypothetical protein